MPLSLSELQQIIHDIYGDKDRRRGVPATFMWFMEEVGELATALRSGSAEEKAAEFADVLAWLATLANGAGVDLDEAITRKYGHGCPGCAKTPCGCALEEKP
jgi:NTP pyrophosphatase (non-canonical NTP hydrolase)